MNRHFASRSQEGAGVERYCYHHIQAIIVAIDQYAEKALRNREYFPNRPFSAGAVKTTCRNRSSNMQCRDLQTRRIGWRM
jgi:hypothetical protein